MAKDYKSVPALLKHCTVAIYKTGGLSGSDKDKFVQAWKIARAHLTKYGYLAHGSETGPVEQIKFTPKGAGKTRPHMHEGSAKSKLFDAMSYLLEAADHPVKLEGVQNPDAQETAKEVKPSPMQHVQVFAAKAAAKHEAFYNKLKKKAGKLLKPAKKPGVKKASAPKVKRAKRS